MEANREIWSGRNVCVTGGTGFLGYQVAGLLARLGAKVRVLALPTARPHPVQIDHDGVIECVFGDVRDADTVRRALGDSEFVFHTAGLVSVWPERPEPMYRVHVEGTANVLEAAARVGARVIQTSSIVTVGASRRPDLLDEDASFELDQLRVDYVHAKRASERLALEAAANGGDVVVANPGYMVGPEDHGRSVMGRFCLRFWKGRVPITPPGGFNLVDVRDVALGLILAAERGQSGRRYILGGENLDFRAFHAVLAQVAGLKPRAAPIVPWWSLAMLSSLSEARARFTGKEPYPSFQHVLLNRYYWFYRSDRATNELGFRPRPIEISLAEAHAWHSARHGLKLGKINSWWMRPPKIMNDSLRARERERVVPQPHRASST